MESKSNSKPVRKSGISTVAAIVLTAIIVGSAVGGAASYFSTISSDAIVAELRSQNEKTSSQIATAQSENGRLKVDVMALQDVNGRLNSQVSALSSDLRAMADAAGIPINNPEEMKKLSGERKVIEAAKQEGKVVIYQQTQTPGSSAFALRSAFETKYPQVTVEWVTGGATEITNRFLDDYKNAVRGGDVIVLGQQALFDILQKKESLAKYVPKDTEYLSADLKDKDGRWTSHNVVILGIGYNTKLVPKADAPKTYKDLLDPKWKGKIGVPDPKSAPILPALWKTMEKQFGEDYIRQLATQNIHYYRDINEATNKLIAGEISIYLNAGPVALEQSKAAGNPVDWVRLSDNTYISQLGWYGISANASHPNAARLFVDLIFSKEGQQILADGGNLVNMPGVRVPNPDLAVQGKKLIQIESVPDAERTAFLNAFSAKYGLKFP